MTGFAIIFCGFVIGGLIIGFAWAAGEWKRRSDFWKRMYIDNQRQLHKLLNGVEEYLDAEDEGVIRVWVADE